MALGIVAVVAALAYAGYLLLSKELGYRRSARLLSRELGISPEKAYKLVKRLDREEF